MNTFVKMLLFSKCAPQEQPQPNYYKIHYNYELKMTIAENYNFLTFNKKQIKLNSAHYFNTSYHSSTWGNFSYYFLISSETFVQCINNFIIKKACSIEPENRVWNEIIANPVKYWALQFIPSSVQVISWSLLFRVTLELKNLCVKKYLVNSIAECNRIRLVNENFSYSDTDHVAKIVGI